MRKTGIITFHRASSYGAVMQSLALQKAVESLGSEVEIINYHSPGMSQQKPIFSEFCDKPDASLPALKLLYHKDLKGMLYPQQYNPHLHLKKHIFHIAHEYVI